jgi:hypothetical protein
MLFDKSESPVTHQAVKAYETFKVETQASLSLTSDGDEVGFTPSGKTNRDTLGITLDDLYRRFGCTGEKKNNLACPVSNSSHPVTRLGKVKSKLFLVRDMKEYGGVEVEFHLFLTSAIDEASRQLHVAASQDPVCSIWRRDISCCFLESNRDSSVVTLSSHYIECATRDSNHYANDQDTSASV